MASIVPATELVRPRQYFTVHVRMKLNCARQFAILLASCKVRATNNSEWAPKRGKKLTLVHVVQKCHERLQATHSATNVRCLNPRENVNAQCINYPGPLSYVQRLFVHTRFHTRTHAMHSRLPLVTPEDGVKQAMPSLSSAQV